jgi:hypothetical protein
VRQERALLAHKARQECLKSVRASAKIKGCTKKIPLVRKIFKDFVSHLAASASVPSKWRSSKGFRRYPEGANITLCVQDENFETGTVPLRVEYAHYTDLSSYCVKAARLPRKRKLYNVEPVHWAAVPTCSNWRGDGIHVKVRSQAYLVTRL